MILGIDEVGRGSLAGPLVVGIASLKSPIEGLKDSKKLTKNKRGELAQLIMDQAELAKLGWVWPDEIDKFGLTASIEMAIRRAIKGLQLEPYRIVIDGNYNYLPNLDNVECLIKADDLIPEVSAASIIAKVARDKYMYEQSELYPQYGFNENVGYGTKKHIEAIKSQGLSIVHRKSFKLRKELLNNL